MKFLHLSDLHLGKRVNEVSMLDDQDYILHQILEITDAEHPDAVVIAGDVYDKSVPSGEAITLFDWFLVALAKRSIPVLLISGNHDSPERLAFARSLRRRARRRAVCQSVARALPRTLQAAACLIAVLSVGMGVALATSPSAHSWAAGVLHAKIYEETNLFSDTGRVPTQYFGDEPLSGFRGGAALGDALYLAGGINSDDDIYVQTPGDEAYAIYKGNADEECELMNLTAFKDGLYAL